MSVLLGVDPQVNKFEQVSRAGPQMSVVGGGPRSGIGVEGGRSQVWYREGTLVPMLTWGPPPQQND